MIRFLIRRLAAAALVMWLVMTCVFVLVHVVGDPARATLGERASPVQLASFRTKHALDQPLGERYARYLGSDHARARPLLSDEQDVGALIGQRLPRTLLLGRCRFALELVLGIGMAPSRSLPRAVARPLVIASPSSGSACRRSSSACGR